MRSTVSVRGQTVIPRAIRDKLGIAPGTKLAWDVRDGVIVVVPIPKDPIRDLIGILKGRPGLSVADLLAERQKERARERELEERERLRRPPTC